MSSDNLAGGSSNAIDLALAGFTITQPDFIMMIFEILFYGGYTVLFVLYVYLQVQQGGRQRYYQITVLLLYLLGTANMVIAILAYVQELLTELVFVFFFDTSVSTSTITPAVEAHYSVYENLNVAAVATYVTANIIADALLLYRCYVVWGARKYIIVGPFLISLVNTAMAIAAAALEKEDEIEFGEAGSSEEDASLRTASGISVSFLAVNLLTNLILTRLIAGRIWWISRETRRALGGADDKRISSIAAMILESGLLYPVALVIGLALGLTRMVSAIYPILTIIVGMAPTLIMVRTELGISIRTNSDASDSKPDKYDIEANILSSEDSRGSFNEGPFSRKEKELQDGNVPTLCSRTAPSAIIGREAGPAFSRSVLLLQPNMKSLPKRPVVLNPEELS